MYIFQSPKFRTYVTETIIAICIIVYIIELVYLPILDFLALVPLEVFSGRKLWTLITHMFLHDPFDPLHIIFNMWFLWIFGQDLERRMGHLRFLVFYIACGIFAGIFHSWFTLTFLPEFAKYPAIGASGALFGLLAAFALLYPKRKILTFFFPIVVVMEAWKFALFFVGIQILFALVEVLTQVPYSIAFAAHIGGFICGVVLTYIFKLSESIFVYPTYPPGSEYEFRITVYQYGVDSTEMPYEDEEEEEDYYW